MGVVIFFPSFVRDLIHRVAEWVGRRSRRVAERLERLRAGHRRRRTRASIAFNSPRGWLALFWATILSAPSHANKLLAGYVALRALGLHANFVDILLVQTLVMFLLYFAPTPGASGIGEVLSAAVMSSYVPRGADADLHPHLAAHPHLFHPGLRLLRVLELGAAGPEGRGPRALAEPAG